MKKISILSALVFTLAVYVFTEAQEVAAQLRPLVVRSKKNDVSPALRKIPPVPPKAGPKKEIPLFRRPPKADVEAEEGLFFDQALQEQPSLVILPSPAQNFEGVSNADNQAQVGFQVAPPDTNGDVGPNHYVQWVNLTLAVYDKKGNVLMGPVAGNILWSGFGGNCETSNDGDPIVLYDHLADRWFLSQFALPNFPFGPFFQCIAVSQTGDPTGAYHRYEFQIPVDKLNDYPKFGVWSDAYYMSVNEFNSGSLSFSGAGVAAFERAMILNGQPAQMIYLDLATVSSSFFGLLPSDLDGPAPPIGTPNFFASVDDSPDQLNIWEFHVDFATPANSTFGIGGFPNQVLPVASFDSGFGFSCSFFRQCIPQPSPGELVDVISDRLMHRLQFRDFGTHKTLMANHTVDVGASHAGVRWYELRKSGASWSMQQQGTYAPDADHRWMGSIAMDGNGNVALGYSVSSTSTFPSIRYAGREPADPLGTLSTETVLIPGTGAQTSGFNRWGDYSMMGVDPTDDCTFWYTQEYYATTSALGWQTRVGSFRFPSCGAPTDPGLTLASPVPGTAGTDNTFSITGATPAATVVLIAGLEGGAVDVPGCPGVRAGVGDPRVLGSAVADGSGNASISASIPAGAAGKTGLFQPGEQLSCSVGNLVIHSFP